MTDWFNKQKQLIKRRGGFITHIKLSLAFYKIGRDKYVKQYRKRSSNE